MAVINADLRVARDLCARLRPMSIEAHAFDELSALRPHISKHAETLDVVVFGLIVPGGEPSDIVAALRSAPCPAALLLMTRNSTRLASQLATVV